LFNAQREQIIMFTAHYALPEIYTSRDIVEVGGLMSYGASPSDAWRIAGAYAGCILKGEKPADLPVQRSTLIDTVLNLKTPKALGIDVPTATLLRAIEVLE
jgi:putative tryptophan/tyrosine transport system substrate-binding protein